MDEFSAFSYEEIHDAMFMLNQREFLLEVKNPYFYFVLSKVTLADFSTILSPKLSFV